MKWAMATFIQAWRKRQSEQQAKRWSEERDKARRASGPIPICGRTSSGSASSTTPSNS
jgi:hypothetical protein